ncbi:GGDEF domain-containing protein [Reinekea marina]|uniref:GGDEF domain-containing protein n=1 Tax=Reinekea marina TaxID=1310421 RepID=A0ABV7WRV1_9GAMM|nr:GGDEF domain-containing protein [Reinekea marina]MBU2863925.1 GGDEF domain-containing protein [Reinekea forsetii]MDN3648204.1 GGDEF domain-containing protein [Reinekea marina]
MTKQSQWLLQNKVTFLLSNGYFSVISSIVLVLAFSYAKWDMVVQSTALKAWLVLGLILAATRLTHLRVFKAQKGDVNYLFWLRSYRVLTFLSSLLYVALVYLFFGAVSPTFQVVIMFIVVGVTSAAVATHGVDRMTFRLFSHTILLSTMVILLIQPERDFNIMSGLMILFVLVVERASQQTADTMYKNFELTYSMKYRATHDPLVGLYNRSELEHQFEQQFITSPHGIALLFIDLDNFKSLNDTLGHAAGDEALKTVANAIRTQIRSDDVAARLGGDEYVVLLALDDVSIAERIASAICKDIEQSCDYDNRINKVTSSIGLAFKADSAIGFSRLLREADIACYESKSLGKNRVTTRIIE